MHERHLRATTTIAMNAFLTSACAVLMLLSAPAWAEISRDGAAAAAQRMSAGRVLSVEKSGSGSDAVWRVKLVTPQGEVRVILIDAASGQAR